MTPEQWATQLQYIKELLELLYEKNKTNPVATYEMHYAGDRHPGNGYVYG